MNVFMIFEILVLFVVFISVYYIVLLKKEIDFIYLLLQEHEFRLQEFDKKIDDVNLTVDYANND